LVDEASMLRKRRWVLVVAVGDAQDLLAI